MCTDFMHGTKVRFPVLPYFKPAPNGHHFISHYRGLLIDPYFKVKKDKRVLAWCPISGELHYSGLKILTNSPTGMCLFAVVIIHIKG